MRAEGTHTQREYEEDLRPWRV